MSYNNSILLVEDDIQLAQLLYDYFVNFDFSVNTVNTGTEAVDVIPSLNPTLIILDLKLPDMDGLAVCRQIRSIYSGKIMMLTASGDDMDHVAALEMGADDFVQKPIQPRVLLARIRTLLRSVGESNETVDAKRKIDRDKHLHFGELSLNRLAQGCQLNGDAINLTPAEFTLLWKLASEAENVLSRDELLKSLRNIEYDGLDRSIDNKIAQIRKKLNDDSGRPQGIITVRGKGYMFVPEYW